MTSLRLAVNSDIRLLVPCTEVPEDRYDDALAMGLLMLDAMDAWKGVGLSANQCGLTWRLFVYDDRQGHTGIVVNPTLDDHRDALDSSEGCLSLPGFEALIPRSRRVKWSAMNCAPRWSDGLLARIVQHEVDHLNGVLLDRRAA